MSSPLCRQVLVVGSGYPAAGAIIIPTASSVSLQDLMPLLADINRLVPVQSRLDTRLVTILSPTEHFEVSSKGMLKRRLTEQRYHDVIENMYALEKD